ncbi:hypothetical protein D3C79_520210 [compost metagenome]
MLAMAEQPLGDLQAARLALGVFLGDIQPRLGGAQGEIGVRHLRAQQQHGIGVVGLGGKIDSIGRLDGAAESPPEIDLPGDVETQAGLPEHRVASGGRAGLVLFQVQALRPQLLQLWITAGLNDRQLRTRLGDTQAGHAQVGVVRVGFGDQRVECRVGEHRPPLAQVGRGGVAPCLLQQRRAPGVQPRVLRRLEIRADLGTARQHGNQAQGATAGALGHRGRRLRQSVRQDFPAPAAPPIARTARRSRRESLGR